MENIPTSILEVLKQFTMQKLLAAVVILVICIFINKAILKILKKILQKSKLGEQGKILVERCVITLLWILAGLVVLSELGFDTTSMIALVSVFSLGITLATEDILGNMAGGLVLASTKSFAVGDYIKVDSLEGKVKDIHLSHTIMQTLDGYMVTVPNKGLASSRIVNYNTLGRVRIVLDVSASYNDDPARVCAALTEMVKEFKAILPDPAPVIYLDSYGESTINYKIRCWTVLSDKDAATRGMKMRIFEVFKENGFSMEYNHLNVHMIPDKDE